MSLPRDPKERKNYPICTGVLDYFPDAIAEVARVSKLGNDQHNPGQSLHWAREKSSDHADCVARHLIERGKLDTDGTRHSAKLAWRALAMLQLEIEAIESTISPSTRKAKQDTLEEAFKKYLQVRDKSHVKQCARGGSMKTCVYWHEFRKWRGDPK